MTNSPIINVFQLPVIKEIIQPVLDKYKSRKLIGLPNQDIITLIREQGLRVRIDHFRVFYPCILPQAAEAVVAKKTEILTSQSLDFRYELSPQGGATQIRIYPWPQPDIEFGKEVGIWTASFCRPNEQYCKKLGVRLCLTRALHYLTTGESTNIPISVKSEVSYFEPGGSSEEYTYMVQESPNAD